MNEIVFPAAILAPPFFSPPTDEHPYGDPVLNFGAIGAVICHEISHGYDDQGRQYDFKGEISDWWLPSDAEKFSAQAKVMIDQFSKHAFAGEFVNGELTQGENIADLGGVSVAYQALHKWINEHPNHKLETGEHTVAQKIFLSYAQVWKTHIRDELAKQMIVIDPHSPAFWRVNGILANIPEFHQAFGVKEGDSMYLAPSERVKIW